MRLITLKNVGETQELMEKLQNRTRALSWMAQDDARDSEEHSGVRGRGKRGPVIPVVILVGMYTQLGEMIYRHQSN
ncbi:hypothetical protein Nepgr_004764 [Nepenthes gracilis]|uniref:Uncharacterized protein n=1 Tax=Nepenthes gracilis TaxID=150966 RepID=A0AAD3XFM9_NEPGR|nr:hypothetical protein Nepgr_004764 [Nepenthes gracilis]